MQQGRFPDLFGPWSFEPGSVTDLWGLILGVLVLTVTGYVAWKQFKVMNRQLELAEVQDHIIRTQFLQKGELELALRRTDGPAAGYNVKFDIVVSNNGTKSVPDYYWQVLVTQELLNQSNIKLHNHILEPEPEVVDGVSYRVFQRHSDFPIYSHADYFLGSIEIKTLPANVVPKLLWKLNYEDGSAPASGRGVITIPMPKTEEPLEK